MDQNVSNKSLRQYNGMLYKYLIHFYIFIILTRFIIVNSFNFRNKRALRIRCSESMRTIRKVQSCPTNKESWEESARLMDCGKIQQNCSVSPLVYHCLLDQYGKGLMEVCSLTTEIIGRRCPEFNSGAMFVQEHLEERCKQCPFAYNSNEGYLYDECLEVEEALTTTQSTEEKHTTSHLELSSVILGNNTLTHVKHIEGGEENFSSLIIPILLGILLPIISMAIILLLLLNSNTTKSKNRWVDSKENLAEERPLIDENTQTSDKEVIQNWTKDDSHFIESKVFPTIMRKVQMHNYLTFVGVQGSGKSSTIRHIALKLRKEGYEVVPVQDIRNLHQQFLNIHIPQVFVIDDVIGVFGLQMIKLKYLLECEQNIRNPRSKRSKVLMTCREELFDKCCGSFLTNEQHVIRLNNTEDALSDDNKKDIFEIYGLDRDLLSPSSLRKTQNIFPFLCKLYSKEENFRGKSEYFFMSPLQCICEELDDMRNENNICYATLILCVLNDNKVSEENLKNEANKHFQEMKSIVLQNCETKNDIKAIEIVNCLSKMDGIYTKRSGREFSIIHDLLFEIIAYHFGSEFPELVLKYMSSSYIANNVKTISLAENEVGKKICSENKSEFDERFDLSIRLHSSCYSLLAERLKKDLENMELYDVFMNNVLKHPRVCQEFLERLQKDTYKKLKTLFLSEQEDVSKIMIQVDNARSNSGEIGERNGELRKQQLMIQRKLLKKRTVKYFRGISWVVFYGHHQILRYIEVQTEQYKETESELFKELATVSKFDNLESCDFTKQKKKCAEKDSDLDSDDKKRERQIYETSTKKGIASDCFFASERTRLLILGCYSGDIETVKILLKYFDNDLIIRLQQLSSDFYDFLGWDTPLTAACDSGKIAVVDELLHIGANVNQVGKYETPLIAACQSGYLDILERLLEFGADINQSGTFDTPLIAACRGGHISMTKILLKNGARVNQQGKYDTPLTAACKTGHIDIVRELLNYGADFKLPDFSNETPISAANKGKHNDILVELREFGTKFSSLNTTSIHSDANVAEEIFREGIILVPSIEGFDLSK